MVLLIIPYEQIKKVVINWEIQTVLVNFKKIIGLDYTITFHFSGSFEQEIITHGKGNFT